MSAVLYSFRRCPYAMRGRMALKVSGLEIEHREILLRDKPASMLKASPKATVPVVVLDDGRVIEESLDVMAWALENNDPHDWLKCDRDKANALIAENDGPFKHHLDRYKYASRYKDDAKRGDIDLDHRKQAEKFLATLEENLSDSGQSAPRFLLGNKQSIADIAIFPFIRQFANTDREWWESAPYPHVRDWLHYHLESDLFKSVMIKHPLWVDP